MNSIKFNQRNTLVAEHSCHTQNAEMIPVLKKMHLKKIIPRDIDMWFYQIICRNIELSDLHRPTVGVGRFIYMTSYGNDLLPETAEARNLCYIHWCSTLYVLFFCFLLPFSHKRFVVDINQCICLLPFCEAKLIVVEIHRHKTTKWGNQLQS